MRFDVLVIPSTAYAPTPNISESFPMYAIGTDDDPDICTGADVLFKPPISMDVSFTLKPSVVAYDSLACSLDEGPMYMLFRCIEPPYVVVDIFMRTTNHKIGQDSILGKKRES